MYDELAKKVNAVQIGDTSDLVKRADYESKMSKIEKKIADQDHSNKYNIFKGFNMLTAENLADDFVEKTDFD